MCAQPALAAKLPTGHGRDEASDGAAQVWQKTDCSRSSYRQSHYQPYRDLDGFIALRGGARAFVMSMPEWIQVVNGGTEKFSDVLR